MRCHITLLATILLALSLPVATINAGNPPPPKEIHLSSPCHDAMLSACQAGESENATICEMLRGTRVEDSTSLLDFFNNVMELPGRDDLICARLFGTKTFTDLRYSSLYWSENSGGMGLYTHEPTPKNRETHEASSHTPSTSEQETKYYRYTASDGTLTFSDTPPAGGADDLTPYQPRPHPEEVVKPQAPLPPPAHPKREISGISVHCVNPSPLIGEMNESRQDFGRFTGEWSDPNGISDLTVTIEGTVTEVGWLLICGDESCLYNKHRASYSFKWPHGPHQLPVSDYYDTSAVKPYMVNITINPCKVTSATSTISRGTSLQDHVTGLKRIMGEWFRYHMGEGPRPTFPPQSEK